MTKNQQKVNEIVIIIYNFLKKHITLNTDITKKDIFEVIKNNNIKYVKDYQIFNAINILINNKVLIRKKQAIYTYNVELAYKESIDMSLNSSTVKVEKKSLRVDGLPYNIAKYIHENEKELITSINIVENFLNIDSKNLKNIAKSIDYLIKNNYIELKNNYYICTDKLIKIINKKEKIEKEKSIKKEKKSIEERLDDLEIDFQDLENDCCKRVKDLEVIVKEILDFLTDKEKSGKKLTLKDKTNQLVNKIFKDVK
jgi:hypothetical protein